MSETTVPMRYNCVDCGVALEYPGQAHTCHARITWHPQYAVSFCTIPADELAARLEENERLRAQVKALTRDLETGFMQGAYARLKNLQAQEGEALRNEVKALRDVLKRHEWVLYEGVEFCPECRSRKVYGHEPSCRLAALLKEQT